MPKGFHKSNWSLKDSSGKDLSPSPLPFNDFSRPLTDEEFQIAIAQQQSAYIGPAHNKKSNSIEDTVNLSPRDSKAVSSSPSPSISKPPVARTKDGKRLTVKRSGGGKTWEDPSLLEWNPDHFRLFVGNLSGEVTDEMLTSVFGKFPTMSRAKVVLDPRTQRCKGFGFVSFASADDYFKAFKELNGKYIGNHPVQLKKATTELKPVAVKDRRKPYDRRA